MSTHEHDSHIIVYAVNVHNASHKLYAQFPWSSSLPPFGTGTHSWFIYIFMLKTYTWQWQWHRT